PRCPPELRRELARQLAAALDVLAGRRPDATLRRLRLGPRVRGGLATRLRAGGIRGAALRSLHPDPRRGGAVAHFVGTWESESGIRALAGRADRPGGAGPWTITALRLL
ncbi:hypothetical protein, partial [Corynebacterium sphenisci]|uniref:hypothetical protein n=1 Tax=Corynebacterium sphenisci TaxID=191493 RepID=UPI0026DEFD02